MKSAGTIEWTQRSLLIGVMAMLIWTFVGSLGFAWIEGWRWMDALYMSVITISTVGYGEVQPLSAPGKLFASFLIVGGLALSIYTLTRLGQVVLEGELFGNLGRRRMRKELNELVGHYILCGFGRFSRSVAKDLDHKNHPFCIVESDASREPTLRELHYLYLLEDATSDEALLNAGVKKAAAVLALLPSDADNLYVTVTTKALNPSVRIIARTLDERGELKLRRAGATEVFSPYRLASHRIVQAAMAPTVLQFMDHIADRATLEMNLGEARIGEHAKIAGRSLGEADLRTSFGVTVVAVKPTDGKMVFNPGSEQALSAGDTLVVIGHEKNLAATKQALED